MAALIRVALVDDHPVVLSGLEMGLRTLEDIAVVARATTLAEARVIAAREDVDVLLLDLRLPDGNGLELLPEITQRGRPATLILSSFELRQYVAAALRFGADGFVSKTAPLAEVADAIRVVAAGGAAYTSEQLRHGRSAFVALRPREREIVKLLVAGMSNDEIGGALGISPKTVEAHLSRLYQRAGVMTRLELAVLADREGWLDIEPTASAKLVPSRSRSDGHPVTETRDPG
jgi:DNA-binding NarL/FixJ family response regulator